MTARFDPGDHVGDSDLLDDPAALSAAECEVAQPATQAFLDDYPEWVCVFGPAKISGFYDQPASMGYVFAAPLAAADIPFRWEPYEPDLMPSYRAGDGAVDRPFSILVPVEFETDAREALDSLGVESTAWSSFGLPLHAERTEDATRLNYPARLAIAAYLVFANLFTFAISALVNLLRR